MSFQPRNPNGHKINQSTIKHEDVDSVIPSIYSSQKTHITSTEWADKAADWVKTKQSNEAMWNAFGISPAPNVTQDATTTTTTTNTTTTTTITNAYNNDMSSSSVVNGETFTTAAAADTTTTTDYTNLNTITYPFLINHGSDDSSNPPNDSTLPNNEPESTMNITNNNAPSSSSTITSSKIANSSSSGGSNVEKKRKLVPNWIKSVQTSKNLKTSKTNRSSIEETQNTYEDRIAAHVKEISTKILLNTTTSIIKQFCKASIDELTVTKNNKMESSRGGKPPPNNHHHSIS